MARTVIRRRDRRDQPRPESKPDARSHAASPALPEPSAATALATLPLARRPAHVEPAPRPLPAWLRLTLSPYFLAVSDVLAIATGFAIAFVIRFVLEIPRAQEIHSARVYAGFLWVATPIFLATFAAYGLYQRRNLVTVVDQLFRLLTAVLVGLVATIAVSSFVVRGWPDYSRLLLGYLWVSCTFTACAGRFAWVRWRDWLAQRGATVRTVLIIGAGAAGQRVAAHFRQQPHLGYRVLGFLDDTLPVGTLTVDLPRVVGRIADLDDALLRFQPHELMVADPTLTNDELLAIAGRCQGRAVSLSIYPDLFQMLVSDASLVHLRGMTLITIHDAQLEHWQRTVKRWFDVAFSLCVLVLSAPMMLLIAALVKLDSPGPVFYAQERVGQDGKRFHAIKFRSMYHDAETRTGRFWTTPDDPRRTRVGRWLRRFSLDEWPQFINVLVGDMSVVGPRPERPMFVAQFSETVPDYTRRLRERAGLTGWAQVNGLRGDVSIEERTKYDLYYVDNWSLWLDIKIIVRTAFLILRDPNAY